MTNQEFFYLLENSKSEEEKEIFKFLISLFFVLLYQTLNFLQ